MSKIAAASRQRVLECLASAERCPPSERFQQGQQRIGVAGFQQKVIETNRLSQESVRRRCPLAGYRDQQRGELAVTLVKFSRDCIAARPGKIDISDDNVRSEKAA